MKRIIFIGIIVSAVLFSCNKETSNKDDSDLKQDNPEANKEACIEMVFPLTYIMPDGSTITGNDGMELRLAMKDWYEAHPDAAKRHALQYPVDVIFKGRPLTINNETEMIRIKKACEGEKEPCFVFIYPITYILPDGTSITIISEDDRENMIAVRLWYRENPGIEEKPALQYPVKIKFVKDGTIVTINNDEEMIIAKKKCE